jgi:hypothetical protein
MPQLLLSSLLVVPLAAAGPIDHVDVTLGTDFPLRVGGGVVVEGPHRLRGSMHVGVLPEGYVDTINWGLTTFDIYSDDVAEIIDVVLQNSMVLRWNIGWRPLPKRGFYFGVGYQFLSLNGNTTDVSLLQDNMEGGLAEGVGTRDDQINIKLQPHMVHGEAGWEWLIRDRFVLRSSAGFAYTVANRTSITAAGGGESPASEAGIEALDVVGSDYLDYVFEEWVHIPTVGLSAGMRF